MSSDFRMEDAVIPANNSYYEMRIGMATPDELRKITAEVKSINLNFKKNEIKERRCRWRK